MCILQTKWWISALEYWINIICLYLISFNCNICTAAIYGALELLRFARAIYKSVELFPTTKPSNMDNLAVITTTRQN